MSLVSPFGFLFRHLFLRRHANTAIPTVSFSQFFCIIVLCIMFPAPCCCYYPHHQRVSISQLHTTIATIRIPFPAIHYPYVRPFSILPNPPPPFRLPLVESQACPCAAASLPTIRDRKSRSQGVKSWFTECFPARWGFFKEGNGFGSARGNFWCRFGIMPFFRFSRGINGIQKEYQNRRESFMVWCLIWSCFLYSYTY